MSHEFSPGDVFVFMPGDKGSSHKNDPDWVTSPQRKEDQYVLYEKISLMSYPSSSDFFGETTRVARGDVGIVLSALGIPQTMWYILEEDVDLADKYTVYEVMINNKKMNCFGGDMRQIIKHKPTSTES